MFDSNKNITTRDGFYIAAALTSFQKTLEFEEDESYATLNIYSYCWGGDECVNNETEIRSHICSEDELGIQRRIHGNETDSLFYDLDEKY